MRSQRRPQDTPVGRFLVVAFVDSLGTGLFLTASALFFTRDLGLSPDQVGLALSLAGGAGLLCTVPVGRLGDRVGARATLVGLQAWRGACFLAYPLVEGYPAFLVVTCLAGAGEWASAPVVQSLVGSLAGRRDAVRTMSALAVVRNVGFTLAGLSAAVVIAVGDVSAYRTLVLLNAVSFLLSGALLLRVPAPPPARPAPVAPAAAPARPARPGPRYLVLAALNGVLFLHTVVLGVGLPLWLVTATDAPPALLGGIVVVNTVLPLALQVRLSRGADALRPAALRQLRSGAALAVACLLLAITATTGPAWTVAVVVSATVALTLGEVYQSIGAWGVSYGLSPEDRRGYFLSVYSLGSTAAVIAGPLLLTALVLPAGGWGWAGLGVLLAVTGALVPVLARPGTAPPGRHQGTREDT
jgi:MFS family permease